MKTKEQVILNRHNKFEKLKYVFKNNSYYRWKTGLYKIPSRFEITYFEICRPFKLRFYKDNRNKVRDFRNNNITYRFEINSKRFRNILKQQKTWEI